jgi:AbrB family looped-hinge helix DNA binding protein
MVISAMITTIDAAGRVVIPKQIRETAGLKAGCKLNVSYRDGKVEIEPKQPKARLIRERGRLVIAAPGIRKMTVREVDDWIERSRN